MATTSDAGAPIGAQTETPTTPATEAGHVTTPATEAGATAGANAATTGTRRVGVRRTTRRSGTRAARGSVRATTTSTRPRTPVEHVQQLAERAVLVPVGAGLLARDNLVSTVRDLATRYRTRAGLERELKRFERRGATARNRFERQVRRTRTRFERQLRQRRRLIERTLKQNRLRLEREVRSVRRDLGRQSDAVQSRVEKLVSDAQSLLS